MSSMMCGSKRSEVAKISVMEPVTVPLFVSKSIERYIEETTNGYIKPTGEIFTIVDWKIVESFTRSGKTETAIVDSGRREGCELIIDEFLEFDWVEFIVDELEGMAGLGVFNERTKKKIVTLFKESTRRPLYKKWVYMSTRESITERDLEEMLK